MCGDQPGLVTGLSDGVCPIGAQHRAQRAGPQRADHGRQLHRDVYDEAGDEHPCAPIVGSVEAEPKDVVVLDVQDPGRDLEEDATDERQQRDPLNSLGR